MNTALGDDPIDEGDMNEEADRETSDGEFLSEEERDLLVKRLAACGLPTREIIWITGASGRTVARIMQRWGVQRKKPERILFSKKRNTQRFIEILAQYYALPIITLDSLDQLASGNELSLKKLLDLVRKHVSPFHWAIRSCLVCDQPALTSSPSDRYCPRCKKGVKKVRESLEDGAIYG